VLKKAYEILMKMRWMRWLQAAATVLLLAGSLHSWLDDAFQGGIPGFRIPLLGKPGWISFGLAGIVAFAMGGFSLVKKAVTPRLAAGVLAVWLSVFFVFHVAIADSRVLSGLVDSNNEYFDMMRFSARYLPLNVGTEPSLVRLSRNTLDERVAAAWHFLGWGWYFMLAGGLVLLLVPLPTGSARARAGLGFGLLLLPGFLAISPSLSARLQLARGDDFLFKGLYQEAVQAYRSAARKDAGVLLEISIHHKLGMAYYYLNRVDEADCHIYLGDVLGDEKKVEEAEFHYRKAMAQGTTEERTMAARALATLLIRQGLAAFDTGMRGDAIRVWEEASRIFPENETPLYFLSKAYFDAAMNHLAILRGLEILRISRNDILSANICANLGDCYFSLKEYNNARRYYERAGHLDNYRNYRILKDLGGT
jgi:tetratricopeptide (TPR) repeat protein